LRAAWRKLFSGGKKIAGCEDAFLVACSGGSDSAAALLLSRRLLPHAALVACYVDHGLRPAAAVRRDIAAVNAQAAAARARVHLEKVVCDKRSGASPEEEARTRRYEALEGAARSYEAAYVITGHHGDDVAETVLLALMRGSGLDGLASMRHKRPLSASVMLLRPFLGCSKEELSGVAKACRVPTSHDETNDDTRFRRNAVRRALAQLKRTSPHIVRAIARSAALLTDEKALLDGLTARAWESCRSARPAPADSHILSTRRLTELPKPLMRRVIRHAVKQSSGTLRNFSLQHCDTIADAIAGGRGGTYHAGAAVVHLSAGVLQVQSLAAPTGPQRVAMGKSLFLDAAAIRDSRLVVRTPRRGDTCVPSGRHRPISLARFLSKAGVPRMQRSQALLLCADTRIAAVIGVRVMEPFAARDGRPKVEVRWQPALSGPILKQGMPRPKTSPNRSPYV
jgi:tRNA(Ile)-lysidine synthase